MQSSSRSFREETNGTPSSDTVECNKMARKVVAKGLIDNHNLQLSAQQPNIECTARQVDDANAASDDFHQDQPTPSGKLDFVYAIDMTSLGGPKLPAPSYTYARCSDVGLSQHGKREKGKGLS